jgi:hypothetical protein
MMVEVGEDHLVAVGSAEIIGLVDGGVFSGRTRRFRPVRSCAVRLSEFANEGPG